MNLEVGKVYTITHREIGSSHEVKVVNKQGNTIQLKYQHNNMAYVFVEGGEFFRKHHWELVTDEPTVLGKYELEYLIELALATHDKEWFNQLTKQMEVSQ